MNEEDRKELEAMVVGFLQQGLKDNPRGFTLAEFERIFPEKLDEPRDWYKRYGKKDTLGALECIKGSLKVDFSYNQPIIALNLNSDKVDHHLVDLITNQRSAPKKKRGFARPPSSRALSSYSLNRQYQSHNSRNNYRSRLNHDQQYRPDSSFVKKSSPPLAPSFKPSQYRASADPRLSRGYAPPTAAASPSGPMVPPQIKPTLQKPSQPTISTVTSQRQPSAQPSLNVQRLSAPKPPVQSSQPKPKERTREEEDALTVKKSYLRQRIVSLLTRKFSEIKLLHLGSLYELEYSESIDPSTYGYQNLTNLMQDPEISKYISFNYKSPFVTVSAKKIAQSNGKENSNSGGINAMRNNNIDTHLTDKSNTISFNKAKFDAIDPFNVKTMLHNLEPIGEIREPKLKIREIEDSIKYKTFRLIFKSPEVTMKLDDWAHKFEQECRLRPQIRDYGCRTLLEFFKKLAIDLPIRIILSKDEEWIAVADINQLSEWLHKRIAQGHYRAITAIEIRYEHIAFPNDFYTFTGSKELISQNHHPVYILSVKRSNSMWIQLRSSDRIEKHLCIEDAMTAYEDYTKRSPIKLPQNFIKPGFPCAVYDSAQLRWCRALILKAPEVIDRNYDVTALLVDYAIIRQYSVSQIHCLMKPHLKPPVGPIYCSIYGIKDVNTLKVQKQAKVVLQEYTSPPVTLACRFLKAIPSNEPPYLPSDCLEVELIDTRHGKDCNLAHDINHSIEVNE